MPTGSILHYFWLSLGMGALSLLTPCVFPMVPITVSFFANHSSKTRAGALRMAALYGLGIMFTFVALGMSLAILFGASGINKLASNPWVNLLITAIFLGFALSLLGVFFMQLPTGLMNKLNSASSSKQQGSIVGTMLMGLTFSLTSFTCTAPFVGTLLVLAAQGNWRWPLVGMLGFSFVFALPFFLLALLPQLMTQMPRAGGWMNSVKVVMGFLEIAAAMKFLSNADLVWHWNIFTRTTVLCIWTGCLLLVVAYLLGWFRLDHDSPVDAVSGPRVVFALLFLAGAIWLSNGLAGHKLGDIDAFLPPADSDNSAQLQTATVSAEAPWIMNDLKGGLAQAKQEGKPVFVDFTGYTCTNCRWMESNIFSKPAIEKDMNRFVKVRLYTDGDGDIYSKQQDYEDKQFGTVALPLYALLDADGKTIDTSAGVTRDPNAFAAFLAKAK
ncbi:protein-disulfide reductase DsbD family protein [Terriglobus roseus]|uniref:Thiol:disulfide interchange protein DsbD n=1 Tax=Terriglobus roseus TaxID=392734 RepID=A0A1H4JYA6_9BACT|nr:cytochrome c biogenesis protein CcdA [Terriglobus roseus]SEB51279.1 thiol:disulfide interchange protein DsbD [Terriglobus roseus]